MKVKSKISYLSERNSILPGQMAEQLAVEVNVKNVTEQQHGTAAAAGQALIFALDTWGPKSIEMELELKMCSKKGLK